MRHLVEELCNCCSNRKKTVDVRCALALLIEMILVLASSLVRMFTVRSFHDLIGIAISQLYSKFQYIFTLFCYFPVLKIST
jgi:hypothetical protein